jgi:hypothetical protein
MFQCHFQFDYANSILNVNKPVVSWDVWPKKAAISLLRVAVSPVVAKPGKDFAAAMKAS